MDIKYASQLKFYSSTHSLLNIDVVGCCTHSELPASLLPTLPTIFSGWDVQVRPSTGTDT